MIRYFIYVRKSQDRSDRQVMSIEGQINEIKRFAKQQGYIIADILIEKKSAKKPGRPIFNEMIERLNKGDANGILCWKLNRVARNPVDAGTISWLLQGNIIQAIHSKERSYLPTDNVLMMQIDFGIANQFIKDLSSDTKRGLRDKAALGWNPQNILPIGYLHHSKKQQATKQIICDLKRFLIVKKLWSMMETGAYSILEVRRAALQMGLVNNNGKPYATSTFYAMFKNPMYYGKFYWKDETDEHILWDGKHEPMISEITFRKVQRIIAHRNRNIAPRQHSFTYRGLIVCGGCNGHVSAERKLQAICTNCKYKYSIRTNEICPKCNTSLSKMTKPSIIDIVYYRCTRKKNPSCRQKAITEVNIESAIRSQLEEIEISEELYNWTLNYIEEHVTKENDSNSVAIESLKRKAVRTKKKMTNLIEMRVTGEISKIEAESLKTKFEKNLINIEQQIFEKENHKTISKNEIKRYVNLALNCIKKFNEGDQNTIKELTAFFCSNLTLIDKTLCFSTKKAPEVLNLMRKTLFQKRDART